MTLHEAAPLTLTPYEPPSCTECKGPVTSSSRSGLCYPCSRKAIKGRPRREQEERPITRRPLTLEPGERWGGEGCDSGPGDCTVFRCLENLTCDYSHAGSLHVPATPGRHDAVTLPAKRNGERNVEQADMARAYTAMRVRRYWLLERWGTVCRRDLSELTQAEVGEVMGVTRQRVEQMERKQRGNAAMRKAAREAGIDVPVGVVRRR